MCERSIRPGRLPVLSTSLLHFRGRRYAAPSERATDAALAAWSAIAIATWSVAVRKVRLAGRELDHERRPRLRRRGLRGGPDDRGRAPLGKRRGTIT